MLASGPEDVFLNFSLAMEYVKAGRQEEAVTQFARVTDLDPDYIAAYSQQAAALIALGRKDEAQVVLREGIEAAERTGDTHAAQQMNETLALLG